MKNKIYTPMLSISLLLLLSSCRTYVSPVQHPFPGQLIRFVGRTIDDPEFRRFAAEQRLRQHEERGVGSFTSRDDAYWYLYEGRTIRFLELDRREFRGRFPFDLDELRTEEDVRRRLGKPAEHWSVCDGGYQGELVYTNLHADLKVGIRFLHDHVLSGVGVGPLFSVLAKEPGKQDSFQ